MATAVLMPRLGNTVESSIIVNWRKRAGDTVVQGETLCEIETDKATLEVESPASGTLLEVFFNEGDDVPVQTTIAAIGQAGEDVSALRPASAASPAATLPPAQATDAAESSTAAAATTAVQVTNGAAGISPRARHLAERKNLDPGGLAGSGPGGRIIERDVQAALTNQPKLTPLARAMVDTGDYVPPASASGRITSKDLQPSSRPEITPATLTPAWSGPDETVTIPLKGTRKVIAQRMLQSMQTTAQLTMNTFADARAIQAYRQRLKNSAPELGLQKVTINDLILFAVARTLANFPDVNALFAEETITQYRSVHLGFAVDTPRGLIVPVIRHAQRLSLKQISAETTRLAAACQEGKISPDELTGGTFTVTNLGSLGIETFTPVLNPPQVAILGVGNIHLKAVEQDGEVIHLPHLGLSLTINHQVVDGAPGARFLQTFTRNLSQLDLLLAV